MNGGPTWERLSGPEILRGLPRTAMNSTGVAITPSDPNIVDMISETKDDLELWRSDDADKSWRTVNRNPNINCLPSY